MKKIIIGYDFMKGLYLLLGRFNLLFLDLARFLLNPIGFY